LSSDCRLLEGNRDKDELLAVRPDCEVQSELLLAKWLSSDRELLRWDHGYPAAERWQPEGVVVAAGCWQTDDKSATAGSRDPDSENCLQREEEVVAADCWQLGEPDVDAAGGRGPHG
jgi:hypothetical protein